MTGLVIEIKNTGGKWLINGKQYAECTSAEKQYFDQFTKHMKNGNIEGVR